METASGRSRNNNVLETDGGDGCVDCDTLTIIDLCTHVHTDNLVGFSSLILHHSKHKVKPVFPICPISPQEKLGPSFQGTQPGTLCA